ncbi:Hypothetical protein CAP_2494 [Chondromyces apiculatus DSM 436]|uniref:Uncharacterized protein n=1 Tax=Chondromyces apiculatus DSM 436 TaxID=1192034 RepID=A0A017THC2_9BACT|nr:Hypothetical protein CAP_2494 [Chondromyces apiculatus DSM 436]
MGPPRNSLHPRWRWRPRHGCRACTQLSGHRHRTRRRFPTRRHRTRRRFPTHRHRTHYRFSTRRHRTRYRFSHRHRTRRRLPHYRHRTRCRRSGHGHGAHCRYPPGRGRRWLGSRRRRPGPGERRRRAGPGRRRGYRRSGWLTHQGPIDGPGRLGGSRHRRGRTSDHGLHHGAFRSRSARWRGFPGGLTRDGHGGHPHHRPVRRTRSQGLRAPLREPWGEHVRCRDPHHRAGPRCRPRGLTPRRRGGGGGQSRTAQRTSCGALRDRLAALRTVHGDAC